eukprot:3932072-Prymnesium_polylepis.1
MAPHATFAPGSCVKAGGAGGFPHLLPCVGGSGCCGGFGMLLMVALVPCVSVVASRIVRIARRMRAKCVRSALNEDPPPMHRIACRCPVV